MTVCPSWRVVCGSVSFMEGSVGQCVPSWSAVCDSVSFIEGSV